MQREAHIASHKSPYDLTLGMPWFENTTVDSSTQDIGKDAFFWEANLTDDVFNTVKGALTVSHTSPRIN